MTNTISVPRELLERLAVPRPDEKGWTTYDTGIAYPAAKELRNLLEAPAAEAEGLEVVAYHCRDSAEIETLEWRGGSYADEPLCSLPKAQAIIDQLRAANGDLQLHFDTLKADYDQQAARIAELTTGLNEAKYRIEQGRVWNGMGWTLTGLHPHHQQQAIDAIDAAIAAANPA